MGCTSTCCRNSLNSMLFYHSNKVIFQFLYSSLEMLTGQNAYKCLMLKNIQYIFRGAIRTFAFTFIIKMYVVLACAGRSSWWVSSGPRRSVCTGGSATCRHHRAPIDSPSSGPGFCGGCACVKSTHSQHSSISPAEEMSIAHRAPITCFVRLPISSPSGPPAPSLALLLPSRRAICCYCKYLDHSMFIRSTPRMSLMNSFTYSHNAYGWMYILTLLGPVQLIVIIAFKGPGNCVRCQQKPQT